MFCFAGSDYETVVLNEAFSPDTQNDSMCFDLVVMSDSIVEESEVFFVSLLSEDSAVRIPEETGVLSITIIDNDSKSEIIFSLLIDSIIMCMVNINDVICVCIVCVCGGWMYQFIV